MMAYVDDMRARIAPLLAKVDDDRHIEEPLGITLPSSLLSKRLVDAITFTPTSWMSPLAEEDCSVVAPATKILAIRIDKASRIGRTRLRLCR